MLAGTSGFPAYSRGDSWIHGLHPRTKCLMFLLVAASLVAVGRPLGLGLLAGVSFAVAAASSPGRSEVRGLVGLVVLLAAISLLLNSLFTPGVRLPGPAGAPLWPTYEGVYEGEVAALRLAALAALAFALVRTTSPSELGETVEGTLGRIPAFRGAGLAVDAAARFSPGFVADANRVRAIRSIRVNSRALGPVQRLREAGSYVLPLMVSAVRRAERLADAMESRCYSGSSGGTRTAGREDYAALALTVAACALAVALRGV
jgi:energy-coupling factor transport system permease protein